MPQVIRIEDQNQLVPTKAYPHAHWPFENFNPVQSRLIETFEGDSNIALAAQTSAGKTVSAEMYMAYETRVRKGKALYIGPLKALAAEKRDDWTNPAHHFNDMRVSICTGDYRLTNSRIKELDAADVIVMTPEMLASRCRNHKSEKSNFLKDIGTVVFDESHLLTVPGRGDHIEIALMKITEINPNIRVVLLSATMPNMEEICGWVSKLTQRDTFLLESKYRPCPLSVHYESYFDGDKKYEDHEREKVGTAVGIVKYYSDDKFLVFVHTKRTGELTIQTLKRYGIDAEFHNANLDLAKRQKLEKKFKEDPNFRVIVATSTLAWGLNLPARRVVIVGVDRGLSKVENYDIWQMAGRAGRPAYDPRGDVYILVPESKKVDTIARLKRKDPIKSQLLDDMAGHHKTLAFHLVSEIHQNNIKTREGFHEWFKRSLAFHQNHDFGDYEVDKVVELLTNTKAVAMEGDEYKATSVGVVASMFYFSPFDAADLRKNFKNLFEGHHEKNDYALALALADLDSYRFGQIVNKAERTEMAKFQKELEKQFPNRKITDTVTKFAFAYHNMLNGIENPVFSAVQSTLRLDSERTMEVLNALDTMSAKWKESDYFKTLKLRMAYGVKSEYVNLVQIPNVGRVRAEKLYQAKIRTVDDFVAADPATLSHLMNIKVDKVKESIEAAKTIKLENML